MSAYISEVCTVPQCLSVPMSEGECWMCPKHARELEARIADLERLIRPREEPAGAALPPCPFCGEARVAEHPEREPGLRLIVRRRFTGEPDDGPEALNYSVRCGSCSAEGGTAHCAAGARDLWAACGPPGDDRPTPYHVVRERHEREQAERIADLERQLAARNAERDRARTLLRERWCAGCVLTDERERCPLASCAVYAALADEPAP